MVFHYSQEHSEPTAPFNSALATLELIHNISQLIVKISSSQSIDPNDSSMLPQGKAQHIKYRIVRQYFIMARPLIDKKKNEEWLKEMEVRVFNFESRLQFMKQIHSESKKVLGFVEVYDPAFEKELDNVIMEIRDKLQTEGIFMPPKDDPRFAFKQM